MTVRVYRSTDVSAPTLSGTIGSLIALFDAVLVNGYGPLPGAGWTKPFINTNVAVFRTGTGNQRYLRIDDSNATDSRLHAFESMTSDTAYTNCFTISAGAVSSSGGLFLKKSSTADSVVRPWVIVATSSAMYCFIECAGTSTWESTSVSSSGNGQMFFGDFISYRPSDTYNTAIIAPNTATSGGGRIADVSQSITSAAAGHYICRNVFGLGSGGATFQKGIPGLYSSVAAMGQSATSMTYPDIITGGILTALVEIAELNSGNHIVRGRLPGVLGPITSLPAFHGDVIVGTGALASKTLLTVGVWAGPVSGRMFVEISDTW